MDGSSCCSNGSSFSAASSATGYSSIFSRLRCRSRQKEKQKRISSNERSQIRIRTAHNIPSNAGLSQLLAEFESESAERIAHSIKCPFEEIDYTSSPEEEASVQNDHDEAVELTTSQEAATAMITVEKSEPSEVSPETGKSAGTLSSRIAEIFRCFICLGKLAEAQLCPCCSKLVCMTCIKRWLTDQKSECPHCRAALETSQLVSCKFISEITTEVERIHGPVDDISFPEKFCENHGSPLTYFCTTCSVPVCSDCAILDGDHQNHGFEKLTATYERHATFLDSEASNLRSRLEELQLAVEAVDKETEAVLRAKEDRAIELETAYTRLRGKLEEQLKCKLLTLLAQKGTLTQEIENLETVLHQLDLQLTTSSRSDIIAQEPSITKILQGLHKRLSMSTRRCPVSTEFVSEVVPPFEYGELEMKNFSSLREDYISNTKEHLHDSTNTVVYSVPVSAAGVTWRLKVYPDGSGASKGTHISVFLEMVNGGKEATAYEYGVEMLHRTQPHLKVVRRFSSEFEEGACWGYYQFFKIDELEKEGYIIAEEDTVTLQFYVRATTFLQQCLDLRRALSACQIERDEAVTQVAVLRRAFAASIWQQRRANNSKRSAHSDRMDDQYSIKKVLAGAVSEILPDGQQLPVTINSHRHSQHRHRYNHQSTVASAIEIQALRIAFQRQVACIGKRDGDGDGGEGEGEGNGQCDGEGEGEGEDEGEGGGGGAQGGVGSKEKCERWLKSRDNLFQLPATKDKVQNRKCSKYKNVVAVDIVKPKRSLTIAIDSFKTKSNCSSSKKALAWTISAAADDEESTDDIPHTVQNNSL